MMNRLCVVFVIFSAFVIAGCGSVGKSIVAKQAWSENYARAKEVEATSPLMVDGDMSTIGETQTPFNADSGGATSISEAVIKLPEKKNVRRIVISTPNIRSFSVYAAGKDENTWDMLGEAKNNKENKIAMNISAFTDTIKIRVRGTSDDKVLTGSRGGRKRMQYAKGKIQEIEVYGLVEKTSAQATTQTVAPGTPGVSAPGATAQPPVEPGAKAPPAALSLESPQSTYNLMGPIPVKISLKIGPDELVVLADSVKDEMLRTMLMVKTAFGENLACSKPAPPLSKPRPYRATDREVSVREAKTLETGSVITVDIPNLLEYYPVKEPGKYTVQLDMELKVHSNFIGRTQTQIEDLERTIRDVNARANYTQTEKASIIQGLREEIEQLKKKKENRYIVAGSSSKPLAVNSNVLELVVQ